MRENPDGSVTMCEQELELRASTDYAVGRAAEAEDAADWLRKLAGEEFAQCHDAKAVILRDLSKMFDLRAVDWRKKQDACRPRLAPYDGVVFVPTAVEGVDDERSLR